MRDFLPRDRPLSLALRVVGTAGPVIPFLLLRSPDGSRLGLGCLFLGCATLVAAIVVPAGGRRWGDTLAGASRAVGAAVALFLIAHVAIRGPGDRAALLLAALIVAPVLTITPYLSLRTGHRTAAVVFTAGVVLLMKLVAGTVVVLRYGWDADRKGYMPMPWLAPNLLVWTFWAATLVGCFAAYRLTAQWVARSTAPDAA